MEIEGTTRKVNILSILKKHRKLANGYWFHILINAVTIALGFSTFLPLSYVTSYFRGQCALYANVRLLPSNDSVINVDVQRTTWGEASDCDIPIYSAVITTIHAFIWSWFFLMLIWQPTSEDQEIFMLDLSFLSHLGTCFLLLVSSGKLTGGTRHWCDQLTNELGRPGLSQNISTCAGTEDVLWNILEEKHRIYSFLVTTNVCSWLLALSTLAQSYLCAYRLYQWNEDPSRSRTSSKTYIAYDKDISDDEF